MTYVYSGKVSLKGVQGVCLSLGGLLAKVSSLHVPVYVQSANNYRNAGFG